MKTLTLFLAALTIPLFLVAKAQADVVVAAENFDGETVGTTTGTNTTIGSTAFRTRNSLNTEIVNPDANFTTASGNALQIRTNANAGTGFGAISPAAGSFSLPTLANGDTIRITFDMFIQAVPATSGTVEFQLRPDGNNDNVNEYDFVDLHGGSVGDVVSVQADFVVGGTLSAATTTINTFLHFDGTNNNFGENVDIAQIDNLSFDVITAVPEPSSFALLALFGLGMIRRQR